MKIGEFWIFVIADHFSKFVAADVFTTKEACNVVECLEKFYTRYGAPNHVLSDNGKEFTARVVYDLNRDYNVQILHGAPYHPQTQGLLPFHINFIFHLNIIIGLVE